MTTRCSARPGDAVIGAHLPRRGGQVQRERRPVAVGSSSSRPPSSWAMSAATCRPMPWPGEPGRLTPQSKSRSRSSGGMPGPWSDTVTVTPWPSRSRLDPDRDGVGAAVHRGVLEEHVDDLGDVVGAAHRAQPGRLPDDHPAAGQVREDDLADDVVEVDAAAPGRHPVGDQPLEPLHLGPHHRGERVAAVGGQAVAHQPLGRGDAGHGGVDLVQPGAVLAQADLDGVQPQVEVLDLLLLRPRWPGAAPRRRCPRAVRRRPGRWPATPPADRRAQPRAAAARARPGPAPSAAALQPEDRDGEGDGQHAEHDDPDDVEAPAATAAPAPATSTRWRRQATASPASETDGQRVAAQRDSGRERARSPHPGQRPRRGTRTASRSVAASSGRVSEKAPSASPGTAATASSSASQPVVSLAVIRQCR